MGIRMSFLQLIGRLPNAEKVLGLKDESVSQYKTRLFKRSAELYSMLHNRDNQMNSTMNKEAILAEMNQVEALKTKLFDLVEKPRLKWKV